MYLIFTFYKILKKKIECYLKELQMLKYKNFYTNHRYTKKLFSEKNENKCNNNNTYRFASNLKVTRFSQNGHKHIFFQM